MDKKFKIVKNNNKEVIIENTITRTQYVLDLVYTHQDLGKYYCFRNLLNMPYLRKSAFDVIRGLETLGIEKDELENKVNIICEELEFQEPGFAQRAFIEASFIKQTLKNHWDFKKTLTLLTGLCIVPESQLEDIGDYEQSVIEENILEMAKDKNMIDVFFCLVSDKISILSNFAQQDIPSYSQILTNLNQKEIVQKEVTTNQFKILSKIKGIWTNLF